MSAGMPKKFIVDEYEFTDNDTSTVHASNLKHTATESRLKPLPSPPVVMEPTYRDVTVGSTNGVITPVHQRKSFKKQLAMDWENRVREHYQSAFIVPLFEKMNKYSFILF